MSSRTSETPASALVMARDLRTASMRKDSDGLRNTIPMGITTTIGTVVRADSGWTGMRGMATLTGCKAMCTVRT